jgi:hypothetical protein
MIARERLAPAGGRIVAKSDVLRSGVELTFEAGPGVWLAVHFR